MALPKQEPLPFVVVVGGGGGYCRLRCRQSQSLKREKMHPCQPGTSSLCRRRRQRRLLSTSSSSKSKLKWGKKPPFPTRNLFPLSSSSSAEVATLDFVVEVESKKGKKKPSKQTTLLFVVVGGGGGYSRLRRSRSLKRTKKATLPNRNLFSLSSAAAASAEVATLNFVV